MNKNNSKEIEKYIKKIDKLIIDKDIKKTIIEIINDFVSYGKLYIDKDNLYGMYIDKYEKNKKEAKQFFEIKIDGEDIVCNFSGWKNRKIINIMQNTLKNSTIKVYKKEINTTLSYKDNNDYEIEEKEKIYNSNKSLIYESKIKRKKDYYTFDDGEFIVDGTYMLYDNNYWSNYFEIEKYWYIGNGSIINYTLRNHYMDKDNRLTEYYSICPRVFKSEERGTIYNYEHLDKELFIDFMSGKLNIDQVLLEVKKQKKLKKNL